MRVVSKVTCMHGLGSRHIMQVTEPPVRFTAYPYPPPMHLCPFAWRVPIMSTVSHREATFPTAVTRVTEEGCFYSPR